MLSDGRSASGSGGLALANSGALIMADMPRTCSRAPSAEALDAAAAAAHDAPQAVLDEINTGVRAAAAATAAALARMQSDNSGGGSGSAAKLAMAGSGGAFSPFSNVLAPNMFSAPPPADAAFNLHPTPTLDLASLASWTLPPHGAPGALPPALPLAPLTPFA
jgi:hypothetical protein